MDIFYRLPKYKSVQHFFSNFYNVIDLITIVPLFSSFYILQNKMSLYQQPSWIILMEMLKIFRAFRLLKLHRMYLKDDKYQCKNVNSSNDKKRNIQMITVLCRVFCILFIISSLMVLLVNLKWGLQLKIAESVGNSYFNFDQALYFLVATIASVGYGDIAPDNDYTRIFMAVVLVTNIIFISKQSFILSQVSSMEPTYHDFRLFPKQLLLNHKKTNNFIVLLGYFDQICLYNFLFELYNHNQQSLNLDNLKVLLIGSSEPTESILSVLKNTKYKNKIYYMIADIFSD